jgi:hypothetical protein
MDFREYMDPTNNAIDRYRLEINAQAKAATVPPCALAAIVEQESGGQNILQQGISPGPGCGVGLCQITFGVDWSDPLDPRFGRHALLTPVDNLTVGASEFLKPAIDAMITLRAFHGDYMESVNEALLFWVFCCYNAGIDFVEGCVKDHRDPDEETTAFYGTRALTLYQRNLERSATAAKVLR